MKVKKNDVINLMIICLPLCAYKIFSIGEKDISAIFLIWGMLIIIAVLNPREIIKSIKKNPIILLMIFYGLVNSIILLNSNIGSIIQYLLLWLILLFSYRRINEKEINHMFMLFQKVMNIMAIYGIYTFVGRILNFPLSDLWMNGHMVEGYNWYNIILVGGKRIARANGVFVEPSMFSQYIAINILLLLFSGYGKREQNAFWIVINCIALILSFSGTGILLLIVGGVVFLCSEKGVMSIFSYIRSHWIIGVIGIVGTIAISASPAGKYLVSRLREFDPTNTSSISGYIRFVGQFNIAGAVFQTNPFMGLGIGNVQSFIDVYRLRGGAKAFASTACSMIFARYSAELGIIGVLLLIRVYKSFLKKERLQNINYRILIIALIIMIPLCDSGISVNYWFLLYLLNFDIRKRVVDIDVITNRKKKKAFVYKCI